MGRLFGDELHWPNTNHMTLLNKHKVEALAKGFQILLLEEEKHGLRQSGQHAFTVVFRKRA